MGQEGLTDKNLKVVLSRKDAVEINTDESIRPPRTMRNNREPGRVHPNDWTGIDSVNLAHKRSRGVN